MKKAAFADPDLLPTLLSALPEGVFLCAGEAHEHLILYANAAAERMLPCVDKGLVGRTLRDALEQCYADSRIGEKLSDAIKHKSAETIQIENRQNGVVSWVSLTLIPLEKYFICRIDDMCDRQMNELKLAEVHKLEALGQLAGGVAHDFNNILSIIDGYARIAAKDLDEDHADIADYLNRIKQSVRRGASLTNQLLAFGRKNIIQEDVYDLGNMVRDSEALFKPLLDASVRMHIQAEKDVFISCAPDTISQILMNIIVNARDAMPTGGDIYMTIDEHFGVSRPHKPKQKEDFARIRIRDTGEGMDKDTQRRIFDPFFTTKSQGKGTGLGMSMVYGFVEQMHGFIAIDSKLGKGTTVDLYFPLSTERKKRSISQQDDGQGCKVIRLEGYTALIAEDETDLLDLVGNMLMDMGMNVLKAANGIEALACQDDYEGEIDFLITDVVMPEMNGVKLAEMFGSLRPSAKTLFVSGYPAVGKMARVTLPEGANFLPKPVAYDQLAYVLRDLVEETKHKGLLHMAGDINDDI